MGPLTPRHLHVLLILAVELLQYLVILTKDHFAIDTHSVSVQRFSCVCSKGTFIIPPDCEEYPFQINVFTVVYFLSLLGNAVLKEEK